MKRLLGALALLVVLGATPASAKVVGISASPNPALLGERVRHTLDVGVYGRLEVWVSATGFEVPAMGTLPPGTWSFECCPGQTAGTPAWHFRSAGTTAPGAYGFRALSRQRGSFLSTAAIAGMYSSVWVRVR